MKKLKTFIAAILLAMCCVNAHATVTITAPVKPEILDEELVPGESYYLYNVGCERFMNQHPSDRYYAGWSETAHALRLDNSADGYYAFWHGEYYIGDYYDKLSWNYSTDVNNTYVKFDLQKNDDGTYKLVYTHNFTCTIGYTGNGYVPCGATGHNASWILLPQTADEGCLTYIEGCLTYIYKFALYKAIVAADAKGYHVERYEDIYNDETKTYAELDNAANELNNGNSLSAAHSCLFPSWSDYPILITSLGNWGRYGSNNYLEKYSYSGSSGSSNPNVGLKNTLKTSVYIDEPSTMYFTLDCNQRWQNEATMPFQVFVDGELVYDYKGETCCYYYDSYFGYFLHSSYPDNSYRPYGQYYNYNQYNHGYNRHAIDLEPGHHLIDFVTTQKYDGTYEFYTFFRQIGIEKTPTIEVNLAKEGSLGDEVLRAMDNNPLIAESNIRNVRRLKISGKMGDADWAELYNMTQLSALDLTDAQITEIKTGQLSQYYHESLQYLHDVKLPKTLKTIGQEAFYATYIDNVDIPETVTSIGDFAFSNTRLREANIPNVTHVGHNAFRGCTMLGKAVMKNVEWMGINAFAECYNLKDLEFEGTLTTVPQRAFNACDEIENISIPESVTKIELAAFYWNRKSTLNKLPDNLQTIEYDAFYDNYYATFSLPKTLKTVGTRAFKYCNSLSGDIPSSITSFGESAFESTSCLNMPDTLHLSPKATYGSNLFLYSKLKNVVIPEDCYNFNVSKAFANCDSLKSIKFMSSTLVKVPANFVDGLDKKSLKILVPDYLRTTYMRDSYWMDFTIEGFSTTEMDSIVIRQNLALSQHDRFEGTPDLAIEKGVQFELEGAAGMDLKSITLSSDLEANNYAQITSGTDHVSINGLASERLYTKANKWYFMSLPFDCNLASTVNENGGRYAIRYYDGASRAAEMYPELIDDGETEVYLYNVDARAYIVNGNEYGTRASYSPTNKSRFKIINNGNGTWTLKNYVSGSFKSMFTSGSAVWLDNNNGANANNWVITPMGNGKYEITNTGIEGAKLGWMLGSEDTRLYIDSNLDATTWAFVTSDVHNANWKNYDCTKDIIPAGTGFIFMTSQDSWTRFYSVDNGTKNRVFEDSANENNEFHYELQKHPSENAANRGWNLVGNPYPNYYNIHRISFAAPITLWNGTTYQAYSLRDDDIAIKPNQAIFVQCPEETSEISFPAAGRQLTSVITDQANVPSRRDAAAIRERQIINLALMPDREEAEANADHTRIVLNEAASLSYELACDASKFMSMDNQVQQLYTLGGNGIKYAINERPAADGQVALGIYIPTDGQYKVQLQRNDAETVLLTDTETGFTTELSNGEYCFTAKAGTHDQRFILTVEPKRAPEATAIESLADEHRHNGMQIYTIDGRRTDNMLHPGTYILRNGDTVRKVLVK